MGTVEGKVVVVTGAGRGIGRAEAKLFASEGACVVVNDPGLERDGTASAQGAEVAGTVVREIEEAGGRAVASIEPCHTQEGANRVIETAVRAFGKVDVLVNNAGIVSDKSLTKMDEKAWSRVIETDLTGTFFCTQAAARQMLAQGQGGRIINTTSYAAFLGNLGQANLAAAKAGVFALTRTSAIELQKHKIYVNAIAPIAKTRMTEDLPMFQGTNSLTPDHVAPVALFFGSTLAGERTGVVVAVAGAQMYAFKIVQTPGKFKDGDGVWTAQEISDHWDSIVKG